MPGERSAEQIQRDIEQARRSLAVTVDQLAYRTSPKRLVEQTKATLKEKAQTPVGMAVIGTTAALLVVLVVKRLRKP